jgi:Holliday junction resolvase-like predicted endonuclease
MTLNLTTATANIRTDLNDLDNTNYRWTDATIQREIDRAVARYSTISPYLAATQIQTVSGARIYAAPSGAWWIDRVEYPTGSFPRRLIPFLQRLSPLIPDPTSSVAADTGMTATPVSGGGSLSAGVYQYSYTFTTPGGGETKPYPTTVSATAASGGSMALGAIPTGPSGVTGRNLYRTKVGGSTLYLLASIADTSTTSYTDTTPDTSLVTTAPAANSTSGIPILELDLLTAPGDTTHVIEITYATKHTLDGSGTTIPEMHHDALYLGAESFLAQQWLGNVNDNFDYVDGQFRDRVDDTKSTGFWQAFYNDLSRQFEARLRQIKEETNASIAITGQARWGDKPYRWDRL